VEKWKRKNNMKRIRKERGIGVKAEGMKVEK